MSEEPRDDGRDEASRETTTLVSRPNWQDRFFCGIMIAMPSWNIHLEASERLADKLKFADEKRREFLLGSLLPDVNNGYINHPRVIKDHSVTHYAHDQKSSLNFYAENKRQVDAKNPIYLGYIFHLFMDGFYNYDFFHRANHDPRTESLDYDAKNKIKHHDLWILDDKLHHELHFPEENLERYATIASQINPIEITKPDLEEVLEIIEKDTLNDIYKGEPYQFYTEEELYDLMDRAIEGFAEQYLGEEYA